MRIRQEEAGGEGKSGKNKILRIYGSGLVKGKEYTSILDMIKIL